jgi:hypothetical protein
MPLSAPLSEELVEVTEVDGKDGFSLRRALLVLIGECSYPIPRDQVCEDPYSIPELFMCTRDSVSEEGKMIECPR